MFKIDPNLVGVVLIVVLLFLRVMFMTGSSSSNGENIP